MAETTIRGLLRNINANIEFDTAITVSEVINLYASSIKRIANRTTLGPEDAIKILHIIHQILDACENPSDEVNITGAPPRKDND